MNVVRSRRVGGVKRHVGAAGLENREQADDQVERTLEVHADQHLGADAQLAQMPSQAVRPRIELGDR